VKGERTSVRALARCLQRSASNWKEHEEGPVNRRVTIKDGQDIWDRIMRSSNVFEIDAYSHTPESKDPAFDKPWNSRGIQQRSPRCLSQRKQDLGEETHHFQRPRSSTKALQRPSSAILEDVLDSKNIAAFTGRSPCKTRQTYAVPQLSAHTIPPAHTAGRAL
jgi:hypothetical protein